MKSWKKTVMVLLCMGMLGSMTACSGKNDVNDATGGSNTGNSIEEDIENGVDNIEDGAEDMTEDVEDALDGTDENHDVK